MRNDPMQDGTLERVRCGARRKDGQPCAKWPMAGTNRCRLHGGAAPQTQKKARERILAASDHAAARLIEFMNDVRVPWSVRLAATRDLLDRAGVTEAQTVKVGLSDDFNGVLQGILDDGVLRRTQKSIAPSLSPLSPGGGEIPPDDSPQGESGDWDEHEDELSFHTEDTISGEVVHEVTRVMRGVTPDYIREEYDRTRGDYGR